jgi:hypothetical protein
MPRGHSEENLAGFGEIFFLAGDEPAEGGGFGDAGDAAADVLDGAPLVGLGGVAFGGSRVAVGEGLGGERHRHVVTVEVALNEGVGFRAVAGEAVSAEGLGAPGEDVGARGGGGDEAGGVGGGVKGGRKSERKRKKKEKEGFHGTEMGERRRTGRRLLPLLQVDRS